FAHDLPYTPHTRAALHRLAALQPRTLATMHGAAYRGDGEAALLGLADILQDYLANPNAHEEPTCSP
ncbi:MAG: MBL fold metallo-hydrolase, partial [Hyphomonadaceae bacterium]